MASFPLTLTINGNPVTKKNSQQIIPIGGGRHTIVPSKQYTKYLKRCAASIPPELKGLEIETPVNMACRFYMETARRMDLNNLLESVTDILAHKTIKVLKDDSALGPRIVVGHDGSSVQKDAQNPRVEITITPAVETWDGALTAIADAYHKADAAERNRIVWAINQACTANAT